MNRWLVIIGVIVSMVISGCSSQSIIDHSVNNQVSKKEKQEIVIWHTYSEEETKVFENEIIPLFEKENPNIEVKSVGQSYNEQLKSTLIARASAKEAPDVVRMDISWVPHFAKLGLLYPVDHFKDFTHLTNNLFDGPLKSNFYNGRYYGLPLDTNTKVAIYNKNLLARAGYKEPPHTFNELMDIVKKQQYIIGFQDINTWQLLPYFYALGGKLMDPAYSKAMGFLNSKESIQAIETLRTLNKNQETANGDKWQGVINGDYLMIDEGPWFYSVRSPQMLQTILNQTVAAPFPVTNGTGSVLGGENLVITKGAKNPEAAWKFVKWMVSKKPQQLMLKTGLMPTNKKIDIRKDIKDYPYYQAFETGIDNAFLRPPVSEWDNINSIFNKYIQLIFSGKIDAAEGLTEAAKEIDPLLKGEKENHG